MRLIYTFLVALTLTVATPLSAVAVAPPAAESVEEKVAEAKAEYLAKLEAMTPAERRSFKKAQRKNIKAALKEHRQAKKAGTGSGLSQTALIICCLIPPLGVFLYEEEITSNFWISLLLTLLFYIPGLVFAILVVTGNVNKKRKK